LVARGGAKTVALSCGLLLFRRGPAGAEVLLGHPGGPFFAGRDAGVWTVPKGLVEGNEPDFDAARREYCEETGLVLERLPAEPDCIPLGEVLQKGGKRVRVWAFEGNCDPEALRSNLFELEWPPRSGRRRSFAELDRFAFFSLADAATHILPAQRSFLDRLEAALAEPSGAADEDQDPHPE
jgi:predicted NUDIX family NTP pyrophosphohydrolase